MGKENIEKYSIRHAVLKYFIGMWHDKIFYRKIIVLGRENINPDDHLILAPNHQNALMDALAVLIFLIIPVTGIFAWNYNILFRRIIGGFRIKSYIKEKNEEYIILKKNHSELINLIAGL